MKLIEPAFNGFFKNRKIKLYILSISITISFAIAIFYNIYIINNEYGNKVKNNIINRVLFVSKNDDVSIDNIEKIQDIDVIYNQISSITMTLNGKVDVQAIYKDKTEITDVLLGESFNSENEAQIILPYEIYNTKGEKIELKDYVGKYVELEVEDFKIEAFVSGIYDNINNKSDIYINEFFKEKLVEYNNKILSENQFIAIVNNYTNVNKVIDQINELEGCSANLLSYEGQSDIKIYNLASLLIIVLLIAIVIFVYISIGVILDSMINDEKKDIAILKSIGYKIKHISKIMVYRIYFILTISLVIGVLLSILESFVIRIIINNKMDISLGNVPNLYLFIVLLFIFLVYFISFITIKLNTNKIKKISIIELLKEE